MVDAAAFMALNVEAGTITESFHLDLTVGYLEQNEI